MNKRDIAIGAVILIVLLGAIYLLRSSGSDSSTNATPTASPISVEEKIESVFKVTIPENADKAELKGTENSDTSGIATRNLEKGFSLTILADLPDPETGVVYKANLRKADSTKPEDAVQLGTLKIAKGGWMIDYQSNTDLKDFKNVSVVQESSSDPKNTKIVLQGSFK